MERQSARHDLSDQVIHFTRGETPGGAFSILCGIIFQRRLLAGNRMIRGGYPCICFTEAPLKILAKSFNERLSRVRPYSPFGLMFSKPWVFLRGGRPVIYQPEADFTDLPESLRWRHVRYEIGDGNDVDFTWEREWRIRCDELIFGPGDVSVVLPNRDWSDRLVDSYHAEQDWVVQAYQEIDPEIAEFARNPFPWDFVTLG